MNSEQKILNEKILNEKILNEKLLNEKLLNEIVLLGKSLLPHGGSLWLYGKNVERDKIVLI